MTLVYSVGINATVGTTTIKVESASVSLDEARAPYADATFVTPYTEALASALDPRNQPRVNLVLRQNFIGSKTLGDLSAVFPNPQTLAAISTAWAGKTLSQVGDLYRVVWNPPGSYLPTTVRTLDLTVRSRQVDHLAATITVRATSDEPLLTDYALLRSTPVMPDSYSVVDAVKLVLRTVLPGAVLVATGATGTVLPESAVWRPGVSGWEYLSPLTSSKGLRLWCDEHRIWYLGDPLTAAWPAQGGTSLSVQGFSTTAWSADDAINLDDGLWFDGVVVAYRWTPDAGGTSQVAYDYAGLTSARNVLTIERNDTPYPGPGEASARLGKVRQLGRVIGGTRAADYTVGPGGAATYRGSATNTLSGKVAAVVWDFPDGGMSVRTRNMT